jgi:hypothetical protein
MTLSSAIFEAAEKDTVGNVSAWITFVSQISVQRTTKAPRGWAGGRRLRVLTIVLFAVAGTLAVLTIVQRVSR